MQRCEDERVNLSELKGQIVKKIGNERSRRYFYYLSRFLNQKVSKSEFDKICFRLLGKENLSLHNQLIRSILRNATVAKSPPVERPNKGLTNGSLVPNGNTQSELIRSNGVLPVSPRKVRSGIRERKNRDRPSPLGSNGKVEHSLHPPVCREDNNRGSVRIENGDGPFLRPVEKPRDQVAVTRDDESQEEQARLKLSKSPLIAPLGIPFGGSRKTVIPSTSSELIGCYDNGGLPEREMLRKRMESIAVGQGLGGVSIDCANTLSSMLDVYLKKLIKSCIDLVGARPSNSLLIQEDQKSVSLLDFRIAMELNPQQLGEDWPIIRERISTRSFEEHEFDV